MKHSIIYVFRHTSVSSTYPGPFVSILSDFHSNSLSEPSQSVDRDDIVVADVAFDMEVQWCTWWQTWRWTRWPRKKLADMELDMVADKVTDMVAGHECWLIGP